MTRNREYEIIGQAIAEVGWAGNILWICTVNDYSIHFYDGDIYMNECIIEEGADFNVGIAGKKITGFDIDDKWFRVLIDGSISVSIQSSILVETARVFKRGKYCSHMVYKAGRFLNDNK